MKKTTGVINKICTVFGMIGGVLLGLMMLYTTYDVIQRVITGTALKGSTEIMSYAFCALLYASYCYTQINHSHIHVTIITEMLPGRGKYILWCVTEWVGTLTGIVFAYATYVQAVQQIATNSYTQMLRIPFSPVYLFAFIGTVLFTVALILDAVKATLAVFKKEYAQEVAEANFIKH